jgi:hypothetical protein
MTPPKLSGPQTTEADQGYFIPAFAMRYGRLAHGCKKKTANARGQTRAEEHWTAKSKENPPRGAFLGAGKLIDLPIERTDVTANRGMFERAT